MSTIPGTNIAAMVVPFDTADIYATHNDKYGRGGYRVCDTTTDRDAIPDLRRKAGMWVKCLDDGKVYELGAGLTNADWSIVVIGAGGGGSSAVSNVLSSDTSVASDTSYIVASYLQVGAALTVSGNLMVIG